MTRQSKARKHPAAATDLVVVNGPAGPTNALASGKLFQRRCDEGIFNLVGTAR